LELDDPFDDDHSENRFHDETDEAKGEAENQGLEQPISDPIEDISFGADSIHDTKEGSDGEGEDVDEDLGPP